MIESDSRKLGVFPLRAETATPDLLLRSISDFSDSSNWNDDKQLEEAKSTMKANEFEPNQLMEEVENFGLPMYMQKANSKPEAARLPFSDLDF